MKSLLIHITNAYWKRFLGVVNARQMNGGGQDPADAVLFDITGAIVLSQREQTFREADDKEEAPPPAPSATQLSDALDLLDQRIREYAAGKVSGAELQGAANALRKLLRPGDGPWITVGSCCEAREVSTAKVREALAMAVTPPGKR